MRKQRYIFLLLIAVLSGFAISSCEDDDVVAAEVTEEAAEGSGETVKTTFTVGISAPDVSADIDPVTRASADNANIEYAKPENGGRFQNIVVVLTDHNDRIYGIDCHNWNDGVGVKEYNVIFSDIKVPATDVTNKRLYKVYAFGNICEEHYKYIEESAKNINIDFPVNKVSLRKKITDWTSVNDYCLSSSIKVDNVYNVSFEPGENRYNIIYIDSDGKDVNLPNTKDPKITSTGMPVNNSATATVVKGNTQFNVALKRVCARLQVTFRNFTGTYKDYETGENKENNVYVDNFVLKGVLDTCTSYFYNGSAPSSTGSKDFDILKALGGSNDHDRNKIENGADLVVSMYVFENKKNTDTDTDAYTYDLKVDRGKSLGQQVQKLQNDNVYVMWSDNLDPKGNGLFAGDYHNTFNRCLGADDNNIVYKDLRMDSPDKIPYGTYTDANKYGNRVFWHYNDRRFQSCKVNLNTDECELTKKYIGEKTASIVNQPAYETKLQNSGHSFTISPQYFDGFNRIALKVAGSSYMMISNDILKARYISGITTTTKSTNPWVFFAKYIIKNGETFSTGTGTSKTAITQIDRNHSYELDFSVMPNYDTKQEILVNCVRTQNEINWSEVQK